MICIYHRTDFDGKCSGAIVLNKHPDCKMYGFDYQDVFEIDRIDPGENVIMVDMTLEKPGQMGWLIQKAGEITWIDHHITTLDIEEKYNAKSFPGYRQLSSNSDDPKGKNSKNRISASELCWKYFYPTRSMPYAVHLLGRYDVWDKSDLYHWDNEILPFQYGMRIKNLFPEDQDYWKLLFRTDERSELIQDIIRDGRAALAYDENLSEKMAKGLWFPIEFEGFKFQAINRSLANSHSAKSVWNPEEFDGVMYFSKGPDSWRITMFTDKDGIDFYPLAKQFGGGGHSQACGFTTTKIMDVLPQLIEF